MGSIKLTSGFPLAPEGRDIFRVYAVEHKEDFGKIKVKMINADGVFQFETFVFEKKDGSVNEIAMNAFSAFAKACINDKTRKDIDAEELIDKYVDVEITHSEYNGETQARIKAFGAKPAEGFDREPKGKALTMGHEDAVAPEVTPEKAEQNHLDIDALLGI